MGKKNKPYDPTWDEVDYRPGELGDGCSSGLLLLLFVLQGVGFA